MIYIKTIIAATLLFFMCHGAFAGHESTTAAPYVPSGWSTSAPVPHCNAGTGMAAAVLGNCTSANMIRTEEKCRAVAHAHAQSVGMNYYFDQWFTHNAWYQERRPPGCYKYGQTYYFNPRLGNNNTMQYTGLCLPTTCSICPQGTFSQGGMGVNCTTCPEHHPFTSLSKLSTSIHDCQSLHEFVPHTACPAGYTYAFQNSSYGGTCTTLRTKSSCYSAMLLLNLSGLIRYPHLYTYTSSYMPSHCIVNTWGSIYFNERDSGWSCGHNNYHCICEEMGCNKCPNGYYNVDGRQCRRCPAGHYCPNRHTAPIPCPPGTWGHNSGEYRENTCQPCHPGTFSAFHGSTACTTCPGTSLSGYNATECVDIFAMAKELKALRNTINNPKYLCNSASEFCGPGSKFINGECVPSYDGMYDACKAGRPGWEWTCKPLECQEH